MVLAIPRGGVIVGEVVAGMLGVPIDVVVPRKVGAPGNPELGLGAVAPGVRVLDPWLIERLGVSEDYLEREIAAEEAETVRRLQAYRGDRPALDLTGKTAIVVDDGVATGGTAVAALRWARAQGAATVVLAVPVAPPQTIQRLSQEADEVVALATPEPFFAVGVVPGLRPDPGPRGARRARARRRGARVKVVEIVLAVAFAAGGVRSPIVWMGRRIDGADVKDHLLYAAFVTGRVGLWFAFAGLFALYASSDAQGRAATDELAKVRWYAVVLLVLGALQLVAGYFLSRRRAEG